MGNAINNKLCNTCEKQRLIFQSSNKFYSPEKRYILDKGRSNSNYGANLETCESASKLEVSLNKTPIVMKSVW